MIFIIEWSFNIEIHALLFYKIPQNPLLKSVDLGMNSVVLKIHFPNMTMSVRISTRGLPNGYLRDLLLEIHTNYLITMQRFLTVQMVLRAWLTSNIYPPITMIFRTNSRRLVTSRLMPDDRAMSIDPDEQGWPINTVFQVDGNG